MDYAAFVARREPEWNELEALLDRAQRVGLRKLSHEELDRLASLHRRASADFAHARAQLPGTQVEVRLRRVAFAGHRWLATRHEPLWPRLVAFYMTGFPRLFRKRLTTMAFACGVFLAATLAGFVMTTMQEAVGFVFLGADAIEGLRDGYIWTDSVAQSAPPSVLSSTIASNNATVAILAWGGGALLGAATLYVLVINGLMFGSVVALTVRYGLFDRLLAFVSAHGPLELLLIIVAAGAGFELARGFLAMDARPRRVRLRENGRLSVRILLGIVPWFFLLGFVEGFVSPDMQVETGLKVLLGVLLVTLFFAYALRPLPAPAAREDIP